MPLSLLAVIITIMVTSHRSISNTNSWTVIEQTSRCRPGSFLIQIRRSRPAHIRVINKSDFYATSVLMSTT